MKTVIELAGEMSKAFETKTRDNGDTFKVLKNGSPEWMRGICHKVHGEDLPDDTIYSLIESAVDTISDCEEPEEIEERLYEVEADVYTSDLTEWLNRRNSHVYYLTEALEEFEPKDGFQLLAVAQKIQIDEVGFATLNALQEIANDE